MATYGDKRDYRKIDIYVRERTEAGWVWTYWMSTTWARTCRDAAARYAETSNTPLEHIRARFA